MLKHGPIFPDVHQSEDGGEFLHFDSTMPFILGSQVHESWRGNHEFTKLPNFFLPEEEAPELGQIAGIVCWYDVLARLVNEVIIDQAQAGQLERRYGRLKLLGSFYFVENGHLLALSTHVVIFGIHNR